MKKNKMHTMCGTNKDSQCNLEPSTETMDGKEKTSAKASYF